MTDDDEFAETAKMIRGFLDGQGRDPIFDPVRHHWEALLPVYEGTAEMSLEELGAHWQAIGEFNDTTQARIDATNDELDEAIREGLAKLPPDKRQN